MADDYPADSTTGGSVSQGGQADGEIEFGNDRDWFALDGLSDGEDYLFHMKGADSGSGTLADSFLRLVDSSGTVLKE
ncbi:MAG: hypothetical protein GWM90_23195, partial [Gemmatimonadetes bacterium]|nr:hypothetical protein [Gemmatimonadota bacterium]NIX46880.1 hypothetical protein [Gemmatimonadota bacterium]NIY11231.1 hypothetical protein [Gemmatimonadota bacterium]